jgi:hypothetical protein
MTYTSRAIPQWCCKTGAGVAASLSRRALRHGCRRCQMNLPLVVSWRWASCRSVPPGSALAKANAAPPPHQNVRSPTHGPYAPAYISGPAHCRPGIRQLRTHTAPTAPQPPQRHNLHILHSLQPPHPPHTSHPPTQPTQPTHPPHPTRLTQPPAPRHSEPPDAKPPPPRTREPPPPPGRCRHLPHPPGMPHAAPTYISKPTSPCAHLGRSRYSFGQDNDF